jgi:flagellar hook-length control protein FliK
LQPQQPSGDAGIVSASDQTVIEEHRPAELATAEPSATQPAAEADAAAAHEGSTTLLRQAGAVAAASVLEANATATLSADKPRAARESLRGKDSASGEARLAGGSTNAPTEETPLAASGQPGPAQVVQSAASGDAASAQRAGEAASGKSDAALRVARQDSGAQQASATGQSGKEQSAAPTGRTAEASAKDLGDGLSTLDRVRFVQRVARAFEAIGARAGTVRLRLSPPELGTLRVEIGVRDGALSAHLQAENHVVRNLLLDNLPALRERLAQQDIRIDRFQVDVFDRSQTGNWQQPAGQSDWQQPGRYRTSLGERAVPAVGKTGRSPSSQHRPSLEGQLDVLI